MVQPSQPMPSIQQMPPQHSQEMSPVQQLSPIHVEYDMRTPVPYLSSTRRSGRPLIVVGIMLALLGLSIVAGIFIMWNDPALLSSIGTSEATSQTLAGQVTFQNTQGHLGYTDSLAIDITGLVPLVSSDHYAAWMVDSTTGRISSLGVLKLQGQQGSLTFATPGKSVLSLGNEVEVTREPTSEALPTGNVILRASIPVHSFSHIKNLLVAYPTTPANVSLLAALQTQSQSLTVYTGTLGGWHNQDQVSCRAQNIVNMLEGQHGAHYHSLSALCQKAHVQAMPDVNLGLLGTNNDGYVMLITHEAQMTMMQADATAVIRNHAQQIILATTDLQQWYTELDRDAVALVQHPQNTSEIAEMQTLAQNALDGVDTNHNGVIDPIQGEAGVLTACTTAEAMVRLNF
jgi:hypothetical protein